MARHSIVEKLHRELSEPIESERQVVYCLVEIRKLLDLSNENSCFQSLKFHCDWAVHTKLDRSGAKRVVAQFDRFQALMERVADSEEDHTVQGVSVLADLSRTVQLESFRDELLNFLGRNGLPRSTAESNEKWSSFLRHYLHVIEDCPLVCTSPEFQHVKEVAVRVLDIKTGMAAAAAGFRVMIEWQWTALSSNTRTSHVMQF